MKRKTVFILIVSLLLVALFINAFIPHNLDDDFYNTDVINGVEYESELTDVRNKEYGIYAFLNNSSYDEKNEFVISVIEVSGILKNKKNLVSYSPILEDNILNPDYKNIVNFPEREIKKGSKYYASVYCGIAPLDCTKLTIDGNDAKLKRMTFNINGQEADFYLYYCVIEQSEYPENSELICTTQQGYQIRIEAIDGEEYSKVTIIK